MTQEEIDNKVADMMINSLIEYGCTPDEMLRILALAKIKFIELKKQENEKSTIKNPKTNKK